MGKVTCECEMEMTQKLLFSEQIIIKRSKLAPGDIQ